MIENIAADSTVFENYLKILIYVGEASYVNFQKPLVIHFCPL